MDSRIAVVAVLLALPLFAFPFASPMPDPTQRLDVQVRERPADLPAPDPNATLGYANFSAVEKRVFDRAAADAGEWVFVSNETAPDDFRRLARSGDADGATRVYVEKSDRHYAATFAVSAPPALGPLALRLGSLAAAVALGTVGAYVLVQRD